MTRADRIAAGNDAATDALHHQITRTEQRAEFERGERLARASARFAKTDPESLVDLMMHFLGTVEFERGLDQLVAAVYRCEDSLPGDLAAAWRFLRESTVEAIAESDTEGRDL